LSERGLGSSVMDDDGHAGLISSETDGIRIMG